MNSGSTTRRFFAIVSTGFAIAALVGLVVWQSSIATRSSTTANEAGVAPSLVAGESEKLATSTAPGKKTQNPTPVATPNLSEDVVNDPLLPPRAYIAPERISQPSLTTTVNTFVPPVAIETESVARSPQNNRENPRPGSPGGRDNQPTTTTTDRTEPPVPTGTPSPTTTTVPPVPQVPVPPNTVPNEPVPPTSTPGTSSTESTSNTDAASPSGGREMSPESAPSTNAEPTDLR
ncbi:hypothetical protein CMUST_03845 [Corynebacterium mustelae]|uniref:Uncharacterized protein n=1 Tax=Corynebacterium mustelae TaxID=571915 RepID=A0A0G3GZZ4_9CORY|nr:hypothetical protein [Corynebacterium mustelae]AKK05113.1 hypothetical protein CMUST_03845 [Corynebacterium mustelae]